MQRLANFLALLLLPLFAYVGWQVWQVIEGDADYRTAQHLRAENGFAYSQARHSHFGWPFAFQRMRIYCLPAGKFAFQDFDTYHLYLPEGTSLNYPNTFPLTHGLRAGASAEAWLQEGRRRCE